MANDDYMTVMLEAIRDQNNAVLEAVGDIKNKVAGLPTREELNELKSDIKVIKATITNTNKQVQAHERRITVVETS